MPLVYVGVIATCWIGLLAEKATSCPSWISAEADCRPLSVCIRLPITLVSLCGSLMKSLASYCERIWRRKSCWRAPRTRSESVWR